MGQITLGLPIPGQNDSSEEPKIPSDFTILQTLLNGNVDRTNLAPGVGTLLLTVKSANYGAVSGDLVLMEGVFAVTAPAPVAGAKFGVIAGFGASGTAPVGIAQHGSELFSGVGFAAGVTSLFLGTPGSSLVFESDGTNWYQIAGQVDSGWVPLTLPAGVSTLVVYAVPSARLQGDTVHLDGLASSSTPIGASGLWATIPTFARATLHKGFAVFGGSGVTNMDIAPNGQVTIGASSVAASFDGLSYRLS